MSVIKRDLLSDVRQVYLIGIGGVGMSSLARVLKYRGLTVSGSDSKRNRLTDELEQEGIKVYLGQRESHFSGEDVVIYSSAISSNHLELKAARERGLKIYHRAEVLSSILNNAETSVGVTGTHGKTTTSSMISFVLAECHKNPTCLIGGDIINLRTNAILGESRYVVAEVDESDKSHELYAPHYAVITNLEEDHIDHYKGFSDLELSFARFLSNIQNPGVVISCCDDDRLQKIIRASQRPNITYGLKDGSDFSAENILLHPFGSEYDLIEAGLYSTKVRLSVPGIHNVLNSMAALCVLSHIGIEMEEAVEKLYYFRGARRRLEVKLKSDELIVIDDYAHHPTEVRASLGAIQKMGRKVTIVFQPHRFTRTRYFYKQFAESFHDIDELILTDIYSAGEENLDQTSSDLIYEHAKGNGIPRVSLVKRLEVLDYLLTKSWAGDVVAFLGAGDIEEVANEFAGRFKNFATT